ncbi:hypothetical protein M422DRAFT_214995 [Sphaerobolus stellatus SS14]|uniref:3-oxoacyl-[acyl-carrier-protein] reductase n=1 Tax=Sphaerobolus stellatus (strain SS14) TaxID=990650 RepID=A0A0C9U523_SPHS4|nr:hypothetical protein M422DRAFT_214995 [Sphaerobolus stellatus SS14]
MVSLTGKVAVITGASSGIGLSAVHALLNSNCSVLGVDIAGAPDVNHDHFAFFQVDLAEAEAPQRVISASSSAFGNRLDILINVAGILDANSSVETLRDEDWDRVIAVNLTAPVRLMRSAVKVMKEQRSGSIINVSSKAGESGAVAGVAYTASKHGLLGVTKNTAWLLKEEGIRCNAITPGAVHSNLGRDIDRSKWDIAAFMKMKPVHDIHANLMTGEGKIHPDVLADVLLFLASDLSRGVTGAVIPIDNAWSVI